LNGIRSAGASPAAADSQVVDNAGAEPDGDEAPPQEAAPVRTGPNKLMMLLPLAKRLLAEPATKKIVARLVAEGTRAVRAKGEGPALRFKWMRALGGH
jgi:hypothetical protein